MKNLKERIATIIEHLKEGIHERDETIAVTLLSALSGQNAFLLGPPGTAKSLLARRLSCAFETNNYFEYLMQRFSTPEELFGPISMTELKKDNLFRNTEEFLPTADFAFLDEIWKSSPAILNTLLTIINEKLFRNGTKVESIPLKALIGASNETPPPGQGLEALYDRFLVRLYVPPLEQKENFEDLLKNPPTPAELKLPAGLVIKNEDWEEWSKAIQGIELSEETLNVIQDIHQTFAEKGEELNIYISDRRWQKAATLLKACAFFSGRKKTNLIDALLLRHCLWTTQDNREEVIQIVEDAIKNSGFETGFSSQEIDAEKEKLEEEIMEELFHVENVYETKTLNEKEYFECTSEYREGYDDKSVTFYIPFSEMKSQKEFHPVDKDGNDFDWIKCNFDSQGSCYIEIDVEQNRHYRDWQETEIFSPKIQIHEDDKKKEVNERLIVAFHELVVELEAKIEERLKEIEEKQTQFRAELETSFIPDNIRDIALKSVDEQLKAMKLRREDCQRIEKLVSQY